MRKMGWMILGTSILLLGACSGGSGGGSTGGDECKRVRMESAKDSPDDEAGYVETYSYDGDGNRVHEERDADPGGRPDEILEFTYDDDGNRTRKTRDVDGYQPVGEGRTSPEEIADGDPDEITTYEYDEQGRRVRKEVDGNVWKQGLNVKHESGDPPDGEPEEVVTFSYDDRGNLVRERRDGLDGDPDGTFDEKTTYEYDDQDRRILVEIDGGLFGDDQVDGEVDYRHEHTYEEDGNRVRTANINPTRKEVFKLESFRTYQYDEEGDLIQEARRDAQDGEPAEKPEEIWKYEYDEEGRRVSKWHDRRPDKEGNRSIEEETYKYDDRGNRVRVTYDERADGEIDGVRTFHYDCP